MYYYYSIDSSTERGTVRQPIVWSNETRVEIKILLQKMPRWQQQWQTDSERWPSSRQRAGTVFLGWRAAGLRHGYRQGRGGGAPTAPGSQRVGSAPISWGGVSYKRYWAALVL